MSNIGSYTSRSFSENQKFLVLDPSTGTTSLVLGSDLVSYITPQLNAVKAETTRLAAENTDYAVGEVIQTTGATAPGDNFAAVYLVVEGGTGDFPMINGNDLLVIRGDEFLREQLIQNTAGVGSDLVAHTGTSDTVTEALDKRTIYVGSVAELEALSLSVGTNVYLTDGGRAGPGAIKSGTHAADPQSGVFIDLANGNYWERDYGDSVSVGWFGAVGDAVADDTTPLAAAVAFSRANGKSLDMSGFRLYLSSLASSIDITELEITGNGIPCDDYADYPYMAATDNFLDHLARYQGAASLGASAVISNYNGAVFTGKTFFVRGVAIYCNPQNASSSGFVQTVKPVGEYGPWSRAVRGDYKNTLIRYCGSYGIYLYGGLEICNISNLNITYTKNSCFYVAFTDVEVNCPIEYLEFYDCSFTYCDQDCVFFEHAVKSIIFNRCGFNGPGRFDARPAPATIGDMKYGIHIQPKVGFTGLQVRDCYAELTQSLLYLDGGYVYDINVTNNTIFYANSTYLRYLFNISSQATIRLNVVGNTYNREAVPVYFGQISASIIESREINLSSINETLSAGLGLFPYYCFLPSIRKEYQEVSGTLGDGTATTATYQIAQDYMGSISVNQAANSQVYLITATFQATQNNNNGAYLLYITKMPSGDFAGASFAASSTLGFTAPPTVAADGTISIPLAEFYRGRVTRIDAAQTRSEFS